MEREARSHYSQRSQSSRPRPGRQAHLPRGGVQARGHSRARRNRRKAAAWLENRGGARNGVSNAESWTTSRRSNESNDRGNKSKRARGEQQVCPSRADGRFLITILIGFTKIF